MKRISLAVVLLASIAAAQSAKSAAPAQNGDSKHLPVRRVVLYKNGVGYFQHAGTVQGSQEITIDFTTAQLNDVIKSMTIVDSGEGKVTGVRYNSTAPVGQRLQGLRLGVGEQTNTETLLRAMRGARVEVKTGGTVALGRIVSVERHRRANARGDVTEATLVLFATDAGELRTAELGPGTSVRIVDRELREELTRYLNVVGSGRDRDLRRMTIATAGTGQRQLSVSYISEVPVWKTTYRIVLPKKQGAKALLQGWAVVDNTVGEDWRNVELSLVAGSPQSFVQQVSQPYYVRRPELPMPESFTLAPQAHAGTVRMMKDAEMSAPGVPGGVMGGVAGGMVGGIMSASPQSSEYRASSVNRVSGQITDPSGAVVANANVTVTFTATGQNFHTRTDSNGTYHLAGLPNGPATVKVESPGFNATEGHVHLAGSHVSMNLALSLGSAAEAVEVTGSVNTSNSMVLAAQASFESTFDVAAAEAAGDLFRYDLKQPITIGKDQSAMVPIANAEIEAEKVTLITDPEKAPLRAVWLRNSTGLTLDEGTFNVVEDNTFAGEGLVQILRPKERRLISYAVDSSIRLSTDDFSEAQPYTRVQVAKGVMRLTREQRQARTYTIHNSGEEPRTVVLEHPLEDGWKLAADIKPEETSAEAHRFRVVVEPGKTTDLTVKEQKPEETVYALTTLRADTIALLVQEKTINPQLEAQLRRVLTVRSEISQTDSSIRSHEHELQTIANDQNRVRENMKALRGSAEEKALLQRYTRQLDTQEDRLVVLRGEVSKLQATRSQQQQSLERMVQELSFDDAAAGISGSGSK